MAVINPDGKSVRRTGFCACGASLVKVSTINYDSSDARFERLDSSVAEPPERVLEVNSAVLYSFVLCEG